MKTTKYLLDSRASGYRRLKPLDKQYKDFKLKVYSFYSHIITKLITPAGERLSVELLQEDELKQDYDKAVYAYIDKLALGHKAA